MPLQKRQTIIDELTDEINELREENDRLKAENARLGGSRGLIQQRRCVHCGRSMPDGPAYFPGYFEEPSSDLKTEAWRHACIYCRGDCR